MSGDIIKQFLVQLGFGVDEGQLNKFTKAVGGAALKVAAISAAIATAATGAFAGIAKISEGFEEFGYANRIIAPAINKAILLRKAMVAAYSEAGINMVQAVRSSIKFNMSLAKTKFQLEGIVKSTALKFLPMLTKQMDIFRTKVSANMPRILAGLEKFVKFIFKAFEGVVILGTRLASMFGRVWDFLTRLDDVTGGWSTKILAAVAAWKLLNLAFLASPVGLILISLLALLALYDDFQTWKEGGESLFDWAAWVPSIDAFVKVLEAGYEVLKQIWNTVTSLVDAFKMLFNGDYKGFFNGLMEYAENLLGVYSKLIDYLMKIPNLLSSLGGGIVDSVSGLFGDSKPLGSSSSPSSGQSVNQVTNINVQGSSDPQATARIVGNEQSRINYDMTRNMKGAVR